jgi:hypothetical protein
VFALHPNQPGLWAWTASGSDDAFLAIDLDGDGRIGDGSELFGDGSTQVMSDHPNGFQALAYYDLESQGGNEDGVIDAHDSVWSRLRLWRDSDHDAFSAPAELVTLDSAGVHSFAFDAQPSTYVDEHGNEFRFTSTIAADAPVSTAVSDVWLVQAPIPVVDMPADDDVITPHDYTLWTCWSWMYAVTAYPWEPCDNAPSASGPIVTALHGQLARLVARYSTSTNKATAWDRSHDLAFNAVNYLPAGPSGWVCEGFNFPEPDSYYPPPYDDDSHSYSMNPIRTKCFSQLIHQGGGGGGGGGGC